MYIRKLTVTNWRAISSFQMDLARGLNLLLGPNESGKSTLVEAVDWALYRDITGSRLSRDEVRSLLPAHNPAARPQVELELVFADCAATITKVVCEDSAARECHLVLQVPGAADQNFHRTEAQSRLRQLLACDGVGPERGGAAERSLLIAHQGEMAGYLEPGSSAIRSTLGINAQGDVVLSNRLDHVRLTVEALRRKELTQDLKDEALQCARANTDAARLRDELAELLRQAQHVAQVKKEIEVLRDEIDGLGVQLLAATSSEEATRREWEALNALRLQQAEAETLLATTERQHDTCLAQKQKAAEAAREVARLLAAQEADATALASCSEELSAAVVSLQAAGAAHEEARAALDQEDSALEEAGRMAEAWRLYQQAFAAHETVRRLRHEMARVQGLALEAASLRDAVASWERSPGREELVAWRASHEILVRLEAEAASNLKLHLDLEQGRAVRIVSDGREPEEVDVHAGGEVRAEAASEIRMVLSGVGTLCVSTGARSLRAAQEELDTLRASLAASLQPWNLALDQLAESLPVWEEKVQALEAARTRSALAAHALQEQEAQHGGAGALASLLAGAEAELKDARQKCQEAETSITYGGKSRSEVQAAYDEAVAAARDAAGGATKCRNAAAVALQKLRDCELQVNQLSQRPELLSAAMAARAGELERLTGDGLSLGEREQAVEELSGTLWRARQELEEARGSRERLGAAVSTWQLEEAAARHKLAEQAKVQLEVRLAELRRDLAHDCEEDPVSRSEQLSAEIEEKQARCHGHEMRLRGLALLDAALQLEQSRLGLALAGPLNEKMTPWLSALPARPTSLSFDDMGSRVESVTTTSAGSTVAIPFAEHSEGLKEQVAFALRLLLASRVAARMPSGTQTVVLDDPFTQTDAPRREGLARVLAEASQTLQVVYVTCHAEHLPRGMAARTFSLTAPDEQVTWQTTEKLPEEVAAVASPHADAGTSPPGATAGGPARGSRQQKAADGAEPRQPPELTLPLF